MREGVFPGEEKLLEWNLNGDVTDEFVDRIIKMRGSEYKPYLRNMDISANQSLIGLMPKVDAYGIKVATPVNIIDSSGSISSGEVTQDEITEVKALALEKFMEEVAEATQRSLQAGCAVCP